MAELVFTLDEPIVSMVEFKGNLYVATASRLYRLHEQQNEMVPIYFVKPINPEQEN